jgi:hypothetical protein
VIDLFGDGVKKRRNLDQDAAEAMTFESHQAINWKP